MPVTRSQQQFGFGFVSISSDLHATNMTCSVLKGVCVNRNRLQPAEEHLSASWRCYFKSGAKILASEDLNHRFTRSHVLGTPSVFSMRSPLWKLLELFWVIFFCRLSVKLRFLPLPKFGTCQISWRFIQWSSSNVEDWYQTQVTYHVRTVKLVRPWGNSSHRECIIVK